MSKPYMYALVGLLLLPCGARAESWPEFRGPTGMGLSAAAEAPTRWSEPSHVEWKTPLPGVAWSSPVFEEDVIWLTTAVVSKLTAEARERIRRQEYADHILSKELSIVGGVSLRVLAVAADSGRVIQESELFAIARPAPVHALNSYASPTPIISAGRLYCHFGSFGTACVDASSGDVIWKTQLEHQESVGPGSSPALHNDVLIVPCDGIDQQYVVGLDAGSGQVLWRTDRPPMIGTEGEMHKAFSTPLILEQDGRVQAVIAGAQWICGYDPQSGQELWRLRHGNGFSVTPRPVYGRGRVYFCTGFMRPQLLAIDPTGTGDVSDTHVRWTYDRQVPSMSSPLLVGREIYFISDRGVATCLNADTGKESWRERIGGNFCASPIMVAGNIYFSNREGSTTVIAAQPTYQLVSVNKLDGAVMASPAVFGRDLLIRTESHLYRVAP